MTFRQLNSTFGALLLGICCGVRAAVIEIPSDYESIQAGLDHTTNGDTLLIHTGVYNENLLVPPHDIVMAGYFLLSGDTSDIAQTILRPAVPGRIITIPRHDEGQDLLLIGLRLSGGVIPPNVSAGGISASTCNLTIRDCLFDSSFAPYGGAIQMTDGFLDVRSCDFAVISSAFNGTLIQCRFAPLTLADCVIHDNRRSAENQSLIHVQSARCQILNCDFSNNGASGYLSILDADSSDRVAISRCVFSDNHIARLITYLDDIPVELEINSNHFLNSDLQQRFFGTEYVAPGSVVKIDSNIIESTYRAGGGSATPFYLTDIHQTSTRLAYNLFLSNQTPDHSAIAIFGFQPDLHVFHNYFIGNYSSSFAVSPGGVVGLFDNLDDSFYENVFYANHGLAVFHSLENSPPGYAQHNYWGHESGPYHATLNPFGQGDTVDTLIVFDPWEADTSFLLDAAAPPRSAAPTEFLIGRVYPNPFNSDVEIEYVVTGTHEIKLAVYDLLGREVQTLVAERQSVGIHRAHWLPDGQASGIYFARLTSANSSQQAAIRKLVYLK